MKNNEISLIFILSTKLLNIHKGEKLQKSAIFKLQLLLRIKYTYFLK